MEYRKKKELAFMRRDIEDSIITYQISNEREVTNANYFEENAKLIREIMHLCQISELSELFKVWEHACDYRKQLLPQGKNIFVRMNNAIHASTCPDIEKEIALGQVAKVAAQMEDKIQKVQAMPRR